MPTSRNVNSLLAVTPGIASNYRPTGGFGAPGVCVGGIGVFCNPGVNGFNVGDVGTFANVGGATATDQTNLAQGRVLVDGQVINAGATVPIVGQTGGYTADIANAQEVNIQVSGALGESETGGSEINIVPKTGGNRFAGDYNTTYTTEKWFATNNGAYPNIPAAFQPVKSDHDISIGAGGPIKRDRLWFYVVGRDQGIHKLPVGVDFWPNKWEGTAGFNYQPDRTKDRVEYTNVWRNISGRVTWQASAKNKFNVFWDEQDFCQDPCTGVVSVYTSPESWFSPQTRPNRLRQVSWTNPLTNKILLEAGLSVTTQFYDTSRAPGVHQPDRHPASRRDGRHGRRGQCRGEGESICRRRLLRVDVRLDQQRDRRRRRDARPRVHARARVHFVRHRRPSREVRLRRRLLRAARDQQGQHHAGDVQLPLARGGLHSAGVRQHQPAVPRGPDQPRAAADPEHGGLQHRLRHAGRSREIPRPLRPGSVDAAAAHRQLRASLRSRDERLRGNLHRHESVRAEPASASPPRTA